MFANVLLNVHKATGLGRCLGRVSIHPSDEDTVHRQRRISSILVVKFHGTAKSPLQMRRAAVSGIPAYRQNPYTSFPHWSCSCRSQDYHLGEALFVPGQKVKQCARHAGCTAIEAAGSSKHLVLTYRHFTWARINTFYPSSSCWGFLQSSHSHDGCCIVMADHLGRLENR